MHKAAALALALMGIAPAAVAQTDRATDITDAQIKEVLEAGALRTPPATDQTLKVVDLGDYQLSVAVIHRGPTGANATARPVPANAQHCGLAAAPAGAKLGPTGMITHDDTVETYVVISGSGTLVTGGQLVDGTRAAADSEVAKILNGPTCFGRVAGDFVSRPVKAGDISVIPAGVPHGWTNITTEVTYLSIRPDPKKVLEHGYVNPAIK